MERDYQALRRTYEGNAKLYHDLHNHIEAIYQCLLQGDTEEAARYCEDLRTPVREISQTVWTGDKALDYLISSKLALAEQEHIKTKVNIEYPHNTNILYLPPRTAHVCLPGGAVRQSVSFRHAPSVSRAGRRELHLPPALSGHYLCAGCAGQSHPPRCRSGHRLAGAPQWSEPGR